MTPRQPRLTLDDPTRPVPTCPTLFHVQGGQALAEPFDTLGQLAARAAALLGPELSVSAAPAQAAYPGLELFPAWGLYAGPAREWVGHAAIQATPRAALEAALAAACAPTQAERTAA